MPKKERRRIPKVTDRRASLLLFIYKFKLERDYSPDFREMSIGINVVSTSGVRLHLQTLRSMKMIDYVDNQARTVHLTEQGKEYVHGLLVGRRSDDKQIDYRLVSFKHLMAESVNP